jgi:hypothetical protein
MHHLYIFNYFDKIIETELKIKAFNLIKSIAINIKILYSFYFFISININIPIKNFFKYSIKIYKIL